MPIDSARRPADGTGSRADAAVNERQAELDALMDSAAYHGTLDS